MSTLIFIKCESLRHGCVDMKHFVGMHAMLARVRKMSFSAVSLFSLSILTPVPILYCTSRVPVEGKSSVSLICMKYRILFFNYYHYQPGSHIIIVYCKHITHARTHARTHAIARRRAHRRRRRTGYRYSLAPNRDGPLRWRQCLYIQLHTHAR